MNNTFISNKNGLFELNQTQKQRVKKACDCCRTSKTKCDGLKPCSKCLSENKFCTYTNSQKSGKKKFYSPNYVKAIEKQSAILKLLLHKLLIKVYSDECDVIDFHRLTNTLSSEKRIDVIEKITTCGVNLNYLTRCLLTDAEYRDFDVLIASLTKIDEPLEAVQSDHSYSNSDCDIKSEPASPPLFSERGSVKTVASSVTPFSDTPAEAETRPKSEPDDKYSLEFKDVKKRLKTDPNLILETLPPFSSNLPLTYPQIPIDLSPSYLKIEQVTLPSNLPFGNPGIPGFPTGLTPSVEIRDPLLRDINVFVGETQYGWEFSLNDISNV